MRLGRLLPVAFAIALHCGQAAAAIIGTCTIMVQGNGAMANNPAINVLSSKLGSGNAATVQVKPSSTLCSILNLLDCYSISTPAPASFLAAPGTGGTNVGFATSFRLNGGAENPGNTPLRVSNGTYNMTVDLVATKNVGIYTAGGYQAQVVVRCE